MHLRIQLRIKNHLGYAPAITQIYKYDTAMITSSVYPPH